LYKLTASVATGFFLTSLTLAYLATNETTSTNEPQSVMDNVVVQPVAPTDMPMIDTKVSDIPSE